MKPGDIVKTPHVYDRRDGMCLWERPEYNIATTSYCYVKSDCFGIVLAVSVDDYDEWSALVLFGDKLGWNVMQNFEKIEP